MFAMSHLRYIGTSRKSTTFDPIRRRRAFVGIDIGELFPGIWVAYVSTANIQNSPPIVNLRIALSFRIELSIPSRVSRIRLLRYWGRRNSALRIRLDVDLWRCRDIFVCTSVPHWVRDMANSENKEKNFAIFGYIVYTCHKLLVHVCCGYVSIPLNERYGPLRWTKGYVGLSYGAPYRVRISFGLRRNSRQVADSRAASIIYATLRVSI